MADISKYLDKAYENKEFAAIADSPVSAISGISDGDAKLLADAFGIKTVRDLAESKYFKIAEAIVALAHAGK